MFGAAAGAHTIGTSKITGQFTAVHTTHPNVIRAQKHRRSTQGTTNKVLRPEKFRALLSAAHLSNTAAVGLMLP